MRGGQTRKKESELKKSNNNKLKPITPFRGCPVVIRPGLDTLCKKSESTPAFTFFHPFTCMSPEPLP